jgi:hypothetical protein
MLSQEQDLRAQGCGSAEEETEEKNPVRHQDCDGLRTATLRANARRLLDACDQLK